LLDAVESVEASAIGVREGVKIPLRGLDLGVPQPFHQGD
jgi:hypothetical protein